jgi:hypothetical protein
MAKKNFEKEKVQVDYTTILNFDEDKSLKDYAEEAKKLITKIKNKDDWAFDFAIANNKKSVERVKRILYPQVANGHQGESGHDWQWQLDVESMGKGSKVRLYLDKVTTKVDNRKNTNTIKVGKDVYTVLECQVTVKGTFSADQKH